MNPTMEGNDLPAEKFVRLTPTWEGVINEFSRVNPIQTSEGRDAMWKELRRLGAMFDRIVAMRNTFDELMAGVTIAFPDAEVGEDTEGQIVIYTGLRRVFEDNAIGDQRLRQIESED